MDEVHPEFSLDVVELSWFTLQRLVAPRGGAAGLADRCDVPIFNENGWMSPSDTFALNNANTPISNQNIHLCSEVYIHQSEA